MSIARSLDLAPPLAARTDPSTAAGAGAAAARTMRAVHHPRYGGPDVLSVVDAPRPTPGPDQVLIEVHASAVTHGDRRLRAADFPALAWLPGRLMTGIRRPRHTIPGSVYAGRIAAIGAAVTRFAIGDQVFGIAMRGAHAQYLVVPATGALAAAPTNLTLQETASLAYGVDTAAWFLDGRVRTGDRIAVIGAMGEVGRAVVQVARHLGATVTAVCYRDHDVARALGAHHVQHPDQPLAAYDVVFDATGTTHFHRYRHAVVPGGRYLALDMTAGGLLAMAASAVARIVTRARRPFVGVAIPSAAHMERVRALLDAGAVRPTIAATFALDDIAAAHAALEAGPRGSIVVAIA